MKNAKILVVEDENIVAIDISNRLKRLGYAVSAIIDSGEEAIEKVAETHPDLVIMDILLSGDMDGITAGEAIRSRFHIPVVYLTAYSDETTLQRAKITEPFGYILKPFEEKELQVTIEIALYKHQIEKQLKEREQRLNTIIKSIGDAIVVTDENGYVQLMNPVAEALTGWNQEEALGKDLVEVLYLINKDTGEATENPATIVLREGIVSSLACSLLVAKDGTERPIGDITAPIHDHQGNITGVVLTFHDITKRQQAEEQLMLSAFYDGPTELPNRVLFLDRLEQAVERTRRREDYRCALLLLDLDDFKATNDHFGHAVGDQLLMAIARRLEMCLRAGDSVARLGADRFGILLEDIHELDEATYIAERVKAALAFPLKLRGHEILTTVSIGIAVSTNGYNRAETLLRDADMAMYRAKVQGKARYIVFEQTISQTTAYSRWENDLSGAINRELRLLYQPIVSLSTGKIAGFEALVRWQHSTQGLIGPNEFIAVAEATSLICSLGAWVLHEACRQISIFSKQFSTKAPLFISVNLSSTQLAQPNFIEQVEQILQQTELDASSLQLEITENVLIPNSGTSSVLQQLRNRGIRLCVDKFTSGYSFLSYLYRFPINTLKIDRALISRIEDEPENWEMVQSIVILAHNLSLNVTAMGVETAQQLSQLRRIRCRYGQGYFFSQPLDSETAAALLANTPQW